MKRFYDWLTSRRAIDRTSTAASVGLLILRLGIGLMMAAGHGWGKLESFTARSASFADPFGLGSTASLSLAVFAEFFCSLALILGLFTRAVLIPLIITMATVVLIVTAADPWPKQELALMYLTPYLALLLAGPGKFSIDRLLSRAAK